MDCATDCLFGLVNRFSKKPIPVLTNQILLESASGLAAKIRSKQVSSEEVIKCYVARINQVNPLINAVVENNFERALEEGRKVDELVASGMKSIKQLEKETPFLGVPFTTKDSMAVRGFRHTAGLHSRKDVIAETDAEVVRLMRQAGAIFLAITNVGELCMWWESSNNVYGTTRNPYDITRIVGGSSGGEGSIIASAGSVIGLGSDVGGSIRIPAFFNGIFGHKPTTGLVNTDGQLPEACGEMRDYNVSGPICRFATDMLPMLKILSHENLNKLNLDKKVDVTSLKYFYMANDGGNFWVSKVHHDVHIAMENVLEYLRSAHGISPQNVNLNKMKHSLGIWSHKMTGAHAPKFAEELTGRKGKLNCSWEVVKWLFRCSNHTLAALSLGLMENLVGPGHRKYESYVNMCSELSKDFDELLGADGVFLYPTHPRPAPYHNQPLFMPFNFSYTAIFNVLGLPATHCPIGLSEDGLPVGIQVVANKYNDHLCLAVACELEKAFGGWVCPSVIAI